MEQPGTQLTWQRSSQCDSGSCVEVARMSGSFAVRDSKDAASPSLIFSSREWSEFLVGVRAGDFDLA